MAIYNGSIGPDSYGGTSLADTINGNGGDDTLNGNAGNDTIMGGDGNDTIHGDDGNDTIDGGIGDDHLYQDASDGISPASGLVIHGGDGNDTIEGGTSGLSIDTLYGDAGNDIIDGHAGKDKLYGGDGDDDLTVWLGDTGYLYGGNGNDHLTGTDRYNYFEGGPGRDNYVTSTGTTNYYTFNLDAPLSESVASNPDLIQGITSADRLVLSAPALPLVFHIADETFSLASNDVQLIPDVVGDGLADVVWHYDSTTHLTNLWVDSDDNGTLTDTDLLVTITGNAALTWSQFYNPMAWRGPEAGSTIYGHNGINTIYGGAGGDVIYGLLGDDTIYGGGGRNYLFGGSGNDLIYGGDGLDDMNGGGGDDVLFGGDGNDHFYDGGDYSDTYADGLYNGTAQPAGNDEMHGEGGDDEFWGAGSRIQSDGSWLHDYYYGDEGNDAFHELAGEVTVDGGSGDDYVQLSTSRGTADGGSGTDMIAFTAYREEEWLSAPNGTNPVRLAYTIDLSNLWSGGVGTISSSQGTVTLTNFERVYDGAGAINLDYAMSDIAGGDDVIIIGADHQGNIGSLLYNRQDIASVGILTGPGNDKVIGGSGTDVIDGGTGNDELHGGAGWDGLIGGDGDDILDGGSGPDHMIGGAGDDTYYVDDAPYDDALGDIVEEGENAGTDTAITSVSIRVIYGVSAGLPNIEVIRTSSAAGTAAIDITGNDLNNTITGNAGANMLDGVAGDDLLNGGKGNDSLIGGDANDVLNGGLGDDTLDGGAGIDTASYAGLGSGVTVSLAVTSAQNTGAGGIDTLSAIENLIGTTHADRLTGDAGNNVLDGGAGADTLAGGGGNDTYWVNAKTDVVVEAAGRGTDTIHAAANYALSANVENLVLEGSANFAGTGNALANRLTGNAGNNVLDGGGGADKMIGGLGNDTYHVDNSADVITEATGGGTDSVIATASFALSAAVENLTLTGAADLAGTGNGLANAITGNGGANALTGLSGNDTLTGGGGSDTLDGGLNNDLLIGGAAADTLTGGSGTDTFKFNWASDSAMAHRDTIEDFHHGEHDRIDLSLIDAVIGGTDDAFSVVGAFGHNAGELVISIVGTDHYLVLGDTDGDGTANFGIDVLSATALVAADFVL